MKTLFNIRWLFIVGLLALVSCSEIDNTYYLEVTLMNSVNATDTEDFVIFVDGIEYTRFDLNNDAGKVIQMEIESEPRYEHNIKFLDTKRACSEEFVITQRDTVHHFRVLVKMLDSNCIEFRDPLKKRLLNI